MPMTITDLLTQQSNTHSLRAVVAQYLHKHLVQRQGNHDISIGHAREVLEYATANPHSQYGILPALYRHGSTEELYRAHSNEINQLLFTEVDEFRRNEAARLNRMADLAVMEHKPQEYVPTFDIYEVVVDATRKAIVNAVVALHAIILKEINQTETASTDEPERDHN